MTEHQTIEYKQIWKDDYLKWLCGFANAQGGVLVIGRNDAGEAVGVSQASKLLEDIPNKVRDILGIMVEMMVAGGRWQGAAGDWRGCLSQPGQLQR